MESATPSSSAPRYSGSVGAGGKFRKPPVSRKRPSTPYDRPSMRISTNKSDDSQADGDGWLSKLVVNPARRLIVGGATRILPSFFSRSDSTSADESQDNQDADATPNAVGDAKRALKLGVSRSTGDAGPSNAVDRLKESTKHDNVEQDKSKILSGDLDLATIENLLKGKQFSREEVNHLTEILKSRLVDVSNAEEEKKTLSVISQRKAEEDLVDREIPSTSIMGKQHNVEKAVLETPMPHLQSNMQDEAAASPIDIARAFMGSQTSDLGLNSYSIKSKDGRVQQHSDLFPTKPYIPTPSSKSSTCWPGAMVQDQRGYLTPQNQRSRYELHNFPRTPYSRTIYSKTKPKLTQLQAGSRFSDIPLTPFQQSRTPNYRQMKSSSDVIDGGYGSVGPIRRVRNNGSLSKGTSNPYSAQITSSQAENRNASRSFMPIFQNNPETGGASGTSNIHSVDIYERTSKGEASPTGPSNETVRKILEQLDRQKPTPKEKAAELKLATEWKRSPSQDATLTPKESSVLATLTGTDLNKSVDPSDNRSSGKGIPASNAVTKTSSSVAKDGRVINDAGAGPSFCFRNIGDSQTQTANEKAISTNNKGKSTSHPWSLDNQINGQDLTRKRPSQPTLKPISFKRPDPQQVIFSDNGRGFTFPFSATASSASEPPTPSIMPSTAAQPKELPAIPTYAFGTKKSSQRVVFSFPSTSSAPVDDGASSDLKFSFGSGKKRVSFGSIGNDAIVIN